MLQVLNPYSGATLRALEQDTRASLQSKVQAAKEARLDWAKLPLAERQQGMRGLVELLTQERDALAATLTEETGKPVLQARQEVALSAERVSFFIEQVDKVGRGEAVSASDHVHERITFEPWGVVGALSACHFPLFSALHTLVPALLTGNVVLYKPSECATSSGLQLAGMLHRCRVPRDALQTVIGGADVGALVAELPLDALFFTGSSRNGQKVAASVAPRMLKLQLELGSKDAAYVAQDADVGAAAAALAHGAFYNAGQNCCAVGRIYVHEKVAAAFLEALVAGVRKMAVGDPTDPATFIGPLTKASYRQVLLAQVKDARAKGGQVLCGGESPARQGCFFAPTVVARANHTMAVMRDESCGPIVGVQAVRGDAEAVALINDTPYGLSAAVFGRDARRLEGLLAQLDVGTVYGNCCARVSPRLPWTGRRQSGLGSTLGWDGLRCFVQPKAWHLKEG